LEDGHTTGPLLDRRGLLWRGPTRIARVGRARRNVPWIAHRP
jgi:hypothetical protein